MSNSRKASILFLLYTFLAQCAGCASAFILFHYIESPCIALVGSSVVPFLITDLFRLPLPWRWMNGVLIPLVVLSSPLSLPPIYFFAPLVALLFLFHPTVLSRVPLYPSSEGMFQAVARELPSDLPFQFIDLGCGGGLLLQKLAKKFPQGRFTGVELGLGPFLCSKFRTIGLRNVSILPMNFWKISLQEYDFVYAFLAPPPMAELWEKFKKEGKADAIFLVNSFPCPAKEIKKVPVLDDKACVLYVYRH